MVASKNVLRTVMRSRFFCLCYSPVIITKDNYGLSNARYHTQLLDVVFYPNRLLSSFRSFYVFSFRGGIRCGILLGTLPSDHTTIKLEYKIRLGFDIIIVRLEASIAVAFQYQFTTTVDQEHIFSPFHVLKYVLERPPVRHSGACLVSTRYAESIGDIGPSVLDNILNASYGRGMGNVRHPFKFHISLGRLLLGQLNPMPHVKESSF
ncbi:UNVERIFIED_CONTAM: hypothetical protein Slati_0198100 [Sesamum latifolium]|uniref:Uncharacterized protein n=1 Tax=Sesamum latifolium TaxID=2727402 RepID=A0AAW2YB96_9LAMI